MILKTFVTWANFHKLTILDTSKFKKYAQFYFRRTVGIYSNNYKDDFNVSSIISLILIIASYFNG